MSTYKQRVIEITSREGIELDYGRDHETKTHRIEIMTYGTPRLIEDSHSYVVDSSHADRHQLDSGAASMANSWKAIYNVLTADWALQPCPGCEGCE